MDTKKLLVVRYDDYLAPSSILIIFFVLLVQEYVDRRIFLDLRHGAPLPDNLVVERTEIKALLRSDL